VLTALFITCYLVVMVCNARNHMKWTVPRRDNDGRVAYRGSEGSTSGTDTIDLLAQSFLMLRPQFCVLLIVTYPSDAGVDGEISKKLPDTTAGPLVGELPYQVERTLIISSEVVKRGDLICVKRGEVIPVDGEVVRGRARAEEGLLTGDLTVLSKGPGDYVLGGSTLLECDEEGVHVLVRCAVEQSVLEQLLGLTLASAHAKRCWEGRRRQREAEAEAEGGVASNDAAAAAAFVQTYIPSHQYFPLISAWQFRAVKLYNCFILLVALCLWLVWNIHGVVDLSGLSQTHHFNAMFFGVHFMMSMSLALSLFLLACPVMMGLLLANALILFLAAQVSFARYGIGIQPARALLCKMNQLSSMVWSKQSLSESHLEVTNVYLLSGYGSGRVLVGGYKREGLDAIDKLCVEGCQPLQSCSHLDSAGAHSHMGLAVGNSHGSPREEEEEEADGEYLSEDLVVYLAGASQLPLQHERPLAHAVTTYARSRLPFDLVTPTSFELAACGGVKCRLSLPSPLTGYLDNAQRPVEVVTGSLEFLRHERIRFSANSLFGNMANLAQKTHGARVLFIAINGQVSGMMQVQRRVLSDAEVTVQAFAARKVQSWMVSFHSSSIHAGVCNVATYHVCVFN
jgi:hypothetical protein